jgi:hypothetical protein
MNTVMAPTIRKAPMAIATMSSISVTPVARLSQSAVIFFT